MKPIKYYIEDERGLTLVETLIAVAIVVILSALVFVNVISYQRSMHHLECDAVAKEILIAAQNHLTMADSEGLLAGFDSSDVGQVGTPSSWPSDAGKGIFYYVYPENPLDNGDVLELMLPYGSIDETIRRGGSYVIRYQLPTAQVLDVFYASPTGRFAHEFSTGDEYKNLEGKRDKRDDTGEVLEDNSSSRVTYDIGDSTIGWCDAGAITEKDLGERLKAPKVTIQNEERLIVIVDNSENEKPDHEFNGELKLVIKGKKSKAVKEIKLLNASYEKVPYPSFDDGVIVSKISLFRLVLDDITTSGKHFAELFSAADTGVFIPGEDLSIEAVAYDSKKLNNIARSGAKIVNSLFDSMSSVSGGSCVARISNMRHLENLDCDVSKVDDSTLKLSGAVQTRSVVWTDGSWSPSDPSDEPKGFIERLAHDKGVSEIQVYSTIGGVATSAGYYKPVNASYLKQYEGKNHSISSVKIDTTGDAGLFEHLSKDCVVKNLELKSFSISSSGGHVGALAGTAENINVSGVLVYNNRVDAPDVEIHTSGTDKAAGGLVGFLKGGAIDYSAASVYVRSDNGSAGGLIGSAESSTDKLIIVKNSYAGGHTSDGVYLTDLYSSEGGPKSGRINVESKQDAGGLVGAISGTGAKISHCYATTSVASATGNEGAFIGAMESTTLTDNYATFGAIDFVGSDASQSGNDEYEVETERAKAIYYDAFLAGTLKNEYPFMTVKQLGGEEPDTSDIMAKRVFERHYGDAEARNESKLKVMLIDAEQLYAKVIDFDYTDRDKTGRTNNGKVTASNIDSSLLNDDGSLNLDKVGKGAIVLTYESVEPDTEFDAEGNITYRAISGITPYKRVLYPEYNATVSNPANSNYETSAFCSSSETDDVETYTEGGKEKKKRTYYVLLDSITTKASESVSNEMNGHFASRFPNLEAGALVRVTATKVGYNGSASAVEDSLFDHIVDGADGSHNVYVSNFRHLENLDSVVSGVGSGYVRLATQADYDEDAATSNPINMVWKGKANAFVVRIKKGVGNEKMNRWPADGAKGGDDVATVTIYGYADGSAIATKDTCYPVSPTAALEYAGNSKSISNVDVKNPEAAGLFGVLPSGSNIHDIELLDCTVESTATETFGAGVLLGGKKLVDVSGISNLTITNVLVRDTTADGVVRVKSKYASGGLVGIQCGSKVAINQCAASVRVESDGTNMYSGGLVGYANGTNCSIENSYAGGHTKNGTYETKPEAINVRAKKAEDTDGKSIAGGLVGYADSLTVNNCYSTASVSASSAGGLIGSAKGGSFEKCYVTGLVVGDTKGCFIAIVEDNPTISSNHYFGIINPKLNPVASVEMKKEQVGPFDESAKTFEDFYRGSNKAYPYDAALKSLYQEKYPYQTIDQLNSDIPTSSFVYGKHYGDWPSPETLIINEGATNSTNDSGE